MRGRAALLWRRRDMRQQLPRYVACLLACFSLWLSLAARGAGAPAALAPRVFTYCAALPHALQRPSPPAARAATTPPPTAAPTAPQAPSARASATTVSVAATAKPPATESASLVSAWPACRLPEDQPRSMLWPNCHEWRPNSRRQALPRQPIRVRRLLPRQRLPQLRRGRAVSAPAWPAQLARLRARAELPAHAPGGC